jgi:hypothetical protein
MTIGEALKAFRVWQEWGYEPEEIPDNEVLDKACSALAMTEHEDE